MNTTVTNYAEKKAKQFLNLLQGYTKGIRLTAILILLLMGVSNAWAASEGSNWYDWASSENVYFDNTNSSYTNVSMLIGRQWTFGGDGIGSSGVDFTKVENTNNLYHAATTWNHYNTLLFIDATGWGWEGDKKVTQRYSYASNYTNTNNVDINGTELFYAASNAKGATLNHQDLTSYTALNYTQTVQQHLSTDGGSNYSASTTALATVKVSSYTLNSKNTTTSSSGTIDSGSSSATCSAARTATVTYTVESVKTGYTFVGWYDGTTQKSTKTTYTYNATAAKTITARFKENTYTVTVNNDGHGTTTPSGAQSNVGQVTGLSIKATPAANYEFFNWTITSGSGSFGSETSASTTFKPTSAATIQANFSPIEYKITYSDLYDVTHDNPTTYTIEDTPITFTDPTSERTGYTFNGWSPASIAQGSTGDKTVSAQWTANTYTVHFDKNAAEATGSMDDQIFTYDEQKELTKNAFILDKYSFVGWAKTKDGEKAYDDQSKVSNLSSTDGATVTLYAKWEPKATYTVTLDQTGAKTAGTTSVIATLGDPMPAIALPTPADGYAFMGYWDGKDGSGTQYYDAAGKSVREWNQVKNTTLYAYFKKAEITSVTLDEDLFDSDEIENDGETSFVTVTSHEIAPKPAGTVVVCWTLCYTNGTPVEGHNAIEENGTVKFAIDGLSAGTYKIVASLRLNDCTGEELDRAEATFVVAGSYTVTIKYTCDGQEIAGRTTIEGHPSRQTAVTAAVIGGYNFVTWELGDGISTTNALTDETINITANYEGYLTATYEKKKLIFLDLSKKFGETDWTAPHIYLYSAEFWDENKGTGATTNCVDKGAMSPVPGTTGMWFYEYEDVNNFNGYVAFTPTNKMSQEYFYDTEVIHRGDFSIGTPVFVPAVGQIANIKNPSEGKNAQYYNKGHWTKYMGGTGYTLKIYNHKEKEGRKELMSVPFVPFTGSSLDLPFTAVVDLEAGQIFGYKIVRDNDKWYKNDADGTMTVNSHTNWPFIEDNSDGLACGIQTVAAGIHTFKLTLNTTSGNFEVSVDYPVTVGDYRILYKDDTRTTYKPSDIKKADELNPVTSFFVRPDKHPELIVQTAARVSNEGVTWYADNHIYFKPNANWKSDGARFAAYFYINNSDYKWVDLKANGDLYSCAKPTDKAYTHVIFCRMNPAHSTNKWDNDYTWDQTINIALPSDDKNLYTLEEGAWKGQIYLKPNSNWKKDGARFAAYFFQDGEEAKWMSMNSANDGAYWCDIPKGYTNVIFCRMNPNNQDNNWDTGDGNPYWGSKTNDLKVPTDGTDMYTVKDGTWSEGGGSWSNSGKSWSTISGSIIDLTDELKEKLDEIKGDMKKAPDSVYTIHLSNNEGTLTIEEVAFYTGNFYIRVDAAAGKWYDYKTNPDNLMTYSAFSESDANSFGEKFSHYKTEWCSDGMNVKFVIANDYSQCISDTLVQDTENSLGNIDEYGNLTNEYNYNANIRFMWNRSTNKVSRAYVASATNPDLKFLVLKTDKPIKNNKDQSVNEIIFQDTQNWIYEYTIKAQPGTRVKLYACYPTDDESKAQHFRGEYNSPATFDESNSVQILGGTGEAWNTIRVLYDFKTNRLMGAWVPESAISTEQAIAADLMVIRRHQENATCVTLTNENSKLTDVKTAYGAMQFNRWTINNRGGADDLDVTHCTVQSGSHRVYDETVTNEHHPVLPLAEQTSIYERGLYFISFPFDVHLSDVFGFGTYGTHWVISTYNGKRRAERGYFAEDCTNEDCTNWDYIWDPSGFVMEANVGYLLSLDLDLMKHDNTSFWANNISQVELFFPSQVELETITKTDYTMPELGPEYECKINLNTTGKEPEKDRRVKDSYWRCIGVPSFADYSGQLKDGSDKSITWQPAGGNLPFLYEWNVTNNNLVVRSATNYRFRPTFAYLIQNGNEIHWEAVNTKPASIIARDQSENMSNYEWKIALLRNENTEDQTFVRVTDNESVTSAFDFHQDLSKEFNYGANIYTLVGYERLAANSLPMSDSTTIIPLGVSAQEAGDYTITMPEGVESIGITLVDTETGTRTNLSAGMEYTFTLNRGTYDSRLYLEISPIEKTPSDLEYVDEATRNQNVRKFIIDGKLYLQKDGMLYDAQGHIVR